ncbi:MAG: hypothetical protein RRC34_12500 [Lentisphaeria bacterium]|nr:hypothetical protein [Lentisphaeria bacterium]
MIPRSKKNIPAYKQERSRPDEEHSRGSMMICRWMFLALLGLGGLLCYVRLQAQTETIRERTGVLTEQCDVLTKTRDNVKVMQESQTTGRKIRALVRQMNLGLQSPRTGQVRRVSIADYPPDYHPSKSKQLVTVAN